MNLNNISIQEINHQKNKEYYHNLNDTEGILRLHDSECMAEIFQEYARNDYELKSFIYAFLPIYLFYSCVNSSLSSQGAQHIFHAINIQYESVKNSPKDPEASSEEGLAKAYWAGFVIQDYAYDGMSGKEILDTIDIEKLLNSFEVCRNMSMPDMKAYINEHCFRNQEMERDI